MLGTVKLEALSTPTIQHFYNQPTQSNQGQDGLSQKTVKNIHGVLHQALQQAVALGFLRFNPSDACTLPRITRKQFQPLGGDQITRFLAAVEGHRHKAALFTGLREGEILGLMWGCIDFQRGTILVDKQLQRSQKKGGTCYFSPPKSNKSRVEPPLSRFSSDAASGNRPNSALPSALAGRTPGLFPPMSWGSASPTALCTTALSVLRSPSAVPRPAFTICGTPTRF